MQLWYASRTGKVERIVSKLGIKKAYKIVSGDEIVEDEYILFTYTDGCGEIPQIVERFLSKNYLLLRGVAGSGNKNFGLNFCKSVHTIHNRYGVPILMTFDLGGTVDQIQAFRERLISLEVN